MTKITVERGALLSALSFVSRYAGRKNTIPVLTHIRIDADDGIVTAVATDLDQSGKVVCAAEVGEAGSFCIPAEPFRKIVESASGSEISISEDGKSASIVSGKQKFSLPVLLGSDLPALPMLESKEGKSFTLEGAILKRVQKQVAFAVMDPRGAYFLTGVAWNAGQGGVSFAATDKKRLSMLTVPCAEEFSIIVPPIDLPDWSGEVAIQASELFIRFQSGSQTVATKLIEAIYPDIKRLFPADTRAILFDREELAAAVKRVSLAQDEQHPSALLVGRNGLASISVKSSDREASDEVRYEGDDFQIAFDCGLILSVLQSFEGEMIELGYVSHSDTATVRDPKDDARSALAFPYRDNRLAEFITDRKAAA